jgi:hypothetical protein
MPTTTDPLDARARPEYFTNGMSEVTDTPPEIQRMLREKIMALSGEMRFIMGSQMFDSAREMVKASLPKGLSQAEQRRLLFKRIYGAEIQSE